MIIPDLGEMTRHEEVDWYFSAPRPLAILGGQEGRVVVDGYEDDVCKEEFHVAITNFLSCSFEVLRDAEEHVFRYYQDANADWDPGGEGYVAIASQSDVWDHVQMGSDFIVKRRAYGDKGIYVSVECECDWEPEHGLQIVLKNGAHVNKVGAYDGHLTNSDAYADPSLEDVVYRG